MKTKESKALEIKIVLIIALMIAAIIFIPYALGYYISPYVEQYFVPQDNPDGFGTFSVYIIGLLAMMPILLILMGISKLFSSKITDADS